MRHERTDNARVAVLARVLIEVAVRVGVQAGGPARFLVQPVAALHDVWRFDLVGLGYV